MSASDDIITEEEYLVREPEAEYRSEFRAGRVRAMAGASPAHGTIAANLARELGNALKRTPCHIYLADMRVKVAAASFYTYPDIVVTCEPPAFDVKDRMTLINPALIIEVLSPTTAAYDRGEKFAYYKKLASLREYVLVSQESARLEHWVREPNGEWREEVGAGAQAVLTLRLENLRVALTEIYLKTGLA